MASVPSSFSIVTGSLSRATSPGVPQCVLIGSACLCPARQSNKAHGIPVATWSYTNNLILQSHVCVCVYIYCVKMVNLNWLSPIPNHTWSVFRPREYIRWNQQIYQTHAKSRLTSGCPDDVHYTSLLMCLLHMVGEKTQYTTGSFWDDAQCCQKGYHQDMLIKKKKHLI